MSEQLKQEVDTAEIDRLETETDVDSKNDRAGRNRTAREQIRGRERQ